MTPERWQQVKRVFEAAADRAPGERREYLDQACGSDAELRTEVESLLASEEQEVSIVDGDLFDFFGRLLAHEQGDDHEGLVLGQYRILKEIGRGGMAAVYAAVRADEQFQQQVAIKLIRRGMDSDMMVARFRQERQILANLDHPNIAQLFDGGVTPEGLPYLVMELIDGEPIDAFCDRRRFSLSQRLELFRRVCNAVHYAHCNLVVHRDLKPSNILVTGDGVPKLLDFGIAKLLESDDGHEDPELTADGPRPMTPEYASPEQVLGQPVTTASDVYALGVLLYRLLTGRRPYQLERMGHREVERVICEQEPERPSTVITRELTPTRDSEEPPTPMELSRLRGGTPDELRRNLRGDLDTIVMMAMRKESERRYGSAEQLAEDVRRYLTGLPVIARDSTYTYLTGKFVRRHRVGVAAAALIFLSLVAGIVATTWQMHVARQERLTAQTVSRFLVELFELSDPERVRGREVTALQLLERSVKELDRLEDQPEVKATLMDIMGRVYLNLGIFAEAEGLLLGALEIRQGILDADDPAIADSQFNVAEFHLDLAHYDDAERLHRSALELRRRRLPQDDERIARSETNLAKLLHLRGRLDEAETFIQAALERQRRALGEEHELVARTLNNLALVLEAQSRGPEAISLYRRALAMNRKLLGDDHPQVAVSLNNLAALLCALGEHDEALALFEKAETLEREELGEAHWSLATTRNNLGICLRIMGESFEAEKLFRSALEMRRAALGANHPYVAASLNNLGNLLYKENKPEEAEPLLRQAITIYEQLPGGPHHDIVTPLGNLALVLQGLGQLRETETLHREALEMNRRLYGETHVRIALNLNNIGDVVRQQGNLEEAADYFRQALDMQRDLVGEKHLLVAKFHLNLAKALRAMKRRTEAEDEYRAAWRLRREILGPDHPDVANVAIDLGLLLVEQEQPDEAEPHLREAVEVYEGQPQERRQPRLAMAQSSLGRCLASLGRYREAESLLLAAHETFSRMYGAQGKWTIAAQRWLEEMYEKRESG